MAIPKGHRFAIEFSDAFPQGLVMVGEISPDTEYQTREDKAAGRPVRQRIDEATGKRQWKATVTDPDEPNGKRASFEITFLADVQPVPTTSQALPGMRPIEPRGGCGALSRRGRGTGTARHGDSAGDILPSAGRRVSPALADLPVRKVVRAL